MQRSRSSYRAQKNAGNAANVTMQRRRNSDDREPWSASYPFAALVGRIWKLAA